MRTYLLSILSGVFLCLSLFAFGSSDSSEVRKQYFQENLKADSLFSLKSRNGIIPFFIHSLGEQAKAPFHMTAKQGLITAGIVGTTIVLFNYDLRIDREFRPLKDRNTFLRNITPHFTELGDYYGYALLTGYGLFNLGTKNYKGFHTAILAAQAAATAGLWIRVGKVLAGRMRPGTTYSDPEHSNGVWFGPFAQFDSKYNNGRTISSFDAFPSGHTGAAFAMAAVFATEYRDKKAVPFIAYSLAGLVGVSRLVQHEHWMSDVIAGGFIGYLCGRQVCSYDKKINSSRFFSNTIFAPSFQNGIGGITMLKAF